MLKFESLANVGDTIRSYDFQGNREAYIQGMVIEKGWMPNGALGFTIQIEVDGANWGREGDTGYVAYETSLEYDGRVELVNWDNCAEEELAISLMKEFA